ncbi:MAG: riboflavin biosynthesis protein RibD [Bacteroidetes bacterium HGW-Bacteroidetes-11]|nr:MAG: riboflavin biosynthesis protein RibD [Bacteroidetes bacterium HGW-Bacteroidetes-11]
MQNNEDIRFMRRAIQLSLDGYGHVNPNPLVGAVLVKDGKIIGEGYHEKYGGHHAEVNAFNHATAGSKGATLYVTLEPCNHYGKTPPCTERIIQEGVSRVVVGMTDPNPLVNKKGINRLIQAGIPTEFGVLEDEIRKINEVFCKFIQHSKPFCALKTAMTLDGKSASYSGSSRWITNTASRDFVHELRHRYAAIMVGVNTIITDNPQLTDRSQHPEKSNPLRVVVDTNGRLPLNASILDVNEAKTLIATTSRMPSEVRKILKHKGVEIMICPESDGRVDLNYLVRKLAENGIDSLLLEGGSDLNFSALQAGIIDKVYTFISPKFIGGKSAFTPIGGQGMENMEDAAALRIAQVMRFDDDIMVEAYLKTN